MTPVRPAAAGPFHRRTPGRARCFALAGLLGAAGCTGGFAHRSVAPLEVAIDLPAAVQRVRIELANGSVTVLPAPPGTERRIATRVGEVRRAAETAELLQRLERESATLVARAGDDPSILVLTGPDVPADVPRHLAMVACEVELTIPADVALDVEVQGSGRLTVEGRRAPLQLHTGRGDLRVTDCGGAADISTGSGNTIVYGHSGDVTVHSKVGDMQVYVRHPGQRLRLVAGVGKVQCLIPPETGFRVDARTGTGKIANGFGLQVVRPSAYSAVMTGTRGDGATEIAMRTDQGHLSLSHKVFD